MFQAIATDTFMRFGTTNDHVKCMALITGKVKVWDRQYRSCESAMSRTIVDYHTKGRMTDDLLVKPNINFYPLRPLSCIIGGEPWW